MLRAGAVTLNLLRASLTAVPFLATLAPCRAEPTPAIHYAPAENLEHVDVALIDRAEHEIDMAAYVLTDWPILQTLTRAADRGVKVRIYPRREQMTTSGRLLRVARSREARRRR